MARPQAGTRFGVLGIALSLALPQPGLAQSVPSPPPSNTQGDVQSGLVSLTVQIDGQVLPGDIDVQVDGGQVQLPLGALARMLSLAIAVYPSQGRASGFVQREALSFELDVAAAMARVSGREKTFDARHVTVMNDDIFVASALLMRWLQLDLEVDLPTRQLRVKPHGKLAPPGRGARFSSGMVQEDSTPTNPAPPRLDPTPTVLAVQLDGNVLSDRLKAYVDGRQVLLPLGELSRLLTLAITVRPEKGSASGFVLSETGSFELDVIDSQVRVGGRERTFDARHVSVVDDDIYVSSQLLAHWLPLDLDVDLQSGQLRVKPRMTLPLQEQLARASSGARRDPPAPPSAVPTKLDANLMVLEVQLDGHVLSDGLNAYVDGRQILLPLGELARLLTLAITVHPDQGSASGFVLREDRSFGLNVAESMVNLGGRERVFESRLATVIGDDIYVASRLLAHWLPVDLEVDLTTLQLRVKPRKRLPLQERLARESAATRLGDARPAVSDPGYPRAISAFQLLSVPAIDQTIGSQLRLGGGSRDVKLSYTAYVTGDLLGMEGAAYIASSRDKPTPDLRLTLGRHDPDGGLLGPLHARSFVAGNINLPSVPNVMLGSPGGNGVALSNRPLNQPSSFDRHSLRGDLPPGWDVTLYYNDALIRYQASRADGQYAFEDLPLSFGLNEFRLVFNGPLGQVRVERKRFLLDQSVVKPGELLYSVAQHRADNGDLRSVAQFDLGLTKAIAANAALVRKPRFAGGATPGYAQLGLRGYWESMIVSSQWTRAQAGGSLLDLGLKTRLGGYSLDLQHIQRQRGFESDLFSSGANALRYRDKLGLSGSFKPSPLPPMLVSLEAVRDAQESGASTLGVQVRASTVLQGTSLSNSLRWQRAAGAASADGSLQLSRRVLDIGLNAQLNYTLRPRTALQSLSLTGDRQLSEGYRVNAGLLHNVSSNVTQATAGLSKTLGSFGLALNGSYSSQRELALGVQFFVALGRNPRSGAWTVDAQPIAGTGAVSARAFVDANMNGVHDPGEAFVPNAGFKVNGGGRHPSRTDSAGTAFIGRLTPGQHADIALDPGTLDDPQWRPLTPGVRVLPRPGLVQTIDFPVVSTTEIDGTVHLVDKAGRRGIGGARIELVDAKGLVVAATTSSPDGYYLLHQIVPGRYDLRIAPDQAAKLRLVGMLGRPLNVAADGDFINGQDFELKLVER